MRSILRNNRRFKNKAKFGIDNGKGSRAKGKEREREYANIHAVVAPSITSKLTFKSGKFASARKPGAELTVDCAGETIVHNKVAYTCALVTRRDPRAGTREREQTRTGGKEISSKKRGDCGGGMNGWSVTKGERWAHGGRTLAAKCKCPAFVTSPV